VLLGQCIGLFWFGCIAFRLIMDGLFGYEYIYFVTLHCFGLGLVWDGMVWNGMGYRRQLRGRSLSICN
jgi:hypothetical protein